MQTVMDRAMVELQTLDFNDLRKVIAWIESIRKATDRVGVQVPWEEILMVFRENGHEPTRGWPEESDRDDESARARHIIRQSLVFMAEDHALRRIMDHVISRFWMRFPAS
jgi:hypothetical protein